MLIPHRRSGRSGAAALEFAVVAPIYIMFVFSLIEFGRTMMVLNLLNEAARLGCRKGIVEGTSTATIKTAVTDFLTKCGVKGEAVTVIINDNVGNVTEASAVPAYTEISVKVSVKVSDICWVPGWMFPSQDTSLKGVWTLRRE